MEMVRTMEMMTIIMMTSRNYCISKKAGFINPVSALSISENSQMRSNLNCSVKIESPHIEIQKQFLLD